MSNPIIVPAQVRAARAMLEWSQDQLATEAGVGLSTVRDVESERRALDTGAASEIRHALENAGIQFVAGDASAGPGVRLVAGRPHVIRPPTQMTMWDGLPFVVEWQGQAITVFVSPEAIDDLGRFTENQTNATYIQVFEKYRGSILDGVAKALKAGRADDKRVLRLLSKDISALK